MSRALLRAWITVSLCLLPFTAAAAPGPDAGTGPPSLAERVSGQRFTATRAFSGAVTLEDAALVAETAAHAAAMRSAMRLLVALPEIRIAGLVAPTPVKPPNLLALAHATMRTGVLLQSKSRKSSTVTITVALSGEDGDIPLEARIRELLIQPERLTLYEEAVLRETALVAAFDALVPTPDVTGEAAGPPAARPVGRAEAAAPEMVNELRALRIYKNLLPSFNGLWKDPAATRDAMQKALILAPDSALVRNAVGDASLQLGRSQEAMEEQTRAIRAAPGFARAYHSRGAAFLALGHLSSAASDFSEAIRLSPGTAAHYRDRGMARHLLGESEAMCADLYEACALGDCEKFQWAAANGFCRDTVRER